MLYVNVMRAGLLFILILLAQSALGNVIILSMDPTPDPQAWNAQIGRLNRWVAPAMARMVETPAACADLQTERSRLIRDDTDVSGTADVGFGKSRWPQIVKAVAWTRKLAKSPPPVQAGALMPRLKAVFADEGVPPELAWIAEVESTFNPRATSRTGARGLFQFTPATAERFGLLVDGTDSRAIPEESARAAARYLAFLYQRFGDWMLAVAGYNAGEGCVARLLERHHATSFYEIVEYLPEETQVYVPKVAATLALRENIRLGALPSPTISPTWN